MVLAVAVGGILVSGGVTAAHATGTWTSYATTVPRLNGSGYTGTQTKTISGAYGGLRSDAVGGDYVVDARLQNSSGGQSGSWARNIGDSSSANLPNSIPSGTSSRVQFSNDATTTVNGQVEGDWRAR